MAKLIPSFFDERTPPGERAVFSMLSKGPDDWVALHSLDVAPWNGGLRTEIDFVVVIPDTGILCIEVKSHDRITFENGAWHPSSIKRSPFKQAVDASHSFHRRLESLDHQLGRIPIVQCCIFPRAPFALTSNLSVPPWELMDGTAFQSFRDGASFCADLRARALKCIAADPAIHRLEAPLSGSRMDSLIRACLPVQKRIPDAKEEIRKRAEECEAMLLAQQKPVLELARLNRRLVVSGPAGTGKTLVAMEVARRKAQEGNRVALLCFNQLVGDWMVRKMAHPAPQPPNLVVGRAIQVMSKWTNLDIPDRPGPDFWANELPDAIEENLTDPDLKAAASIDCLVLDEAQDLLARPRLLACIEHFLDGGFREGSFCLFGDFDHQVLSEREEVLRKLDSMIRVGNPARWHLSENCRNYPIVGETAVRLSGFPANVYSGFLRSGGSVRNYDISYYKDEREQVEKLAKWIDEFVRAGYRESDITILSLGSAENSTAARLGESDKRLLPAWRSGSHIGFTSVHAFKGLENKVVVLTDVNLSDPAFHRDIFYTGMTRATETVRVLCNVSSQKTLMSWIAGLKG
jgi:hypothetical protein